ncbi:serine threonine protein kinase [Musa troglodytarum]|uniref:non-specific serine/threonine protein kinase n=1 Tax=Musa troglodytarum TaxID=320322 RepID=A0A9E7F1A4_9LILI|nr:serine threonine protein kinase [Musa troglodytarum]
MEQASPQLNRVVSRQLSGGSGRRSGRFTFQRNRSFDHRLSKVIRFSFGRQSSLDPNRRSSSPAREELTVPENLDSTMQLLFLASRGDFKGMEELLRFGVDVNSIDLDGRTALHIAACEGHVNVVKLLLSWRVNVDARDRWGSTAAADAKCYGNVEVYNILRARGAKAPKTWRTPMAVSDPQEVPEYELNPGEIQIRRGEEALQACLRHFFPCGTYQVAKWNGTKVSVKILDKESHSDPDSVNSFKHELNLLQKVRHPNVVQFVGAVTQNVPMMIVSEYHSNGDLGSYLQKKGRLQPHKFLRFALEIARGMNYLHQCKPEPIIHCDLKPKNILLDCGGQLKVAGFGLMKLSKISSDKAKLADSKTKINSLSLYMAPEIYRDEIFDMSVDAFSFGLILYEMIEGAPPFHPKNPEEASRLICLKGMRPPLKNKSKSYPPEVKELIEECWDPEPIARPTFSEIIVRLDRIYAACSKQQGSWKETFKLPWK